MQNADMNWPQYRIYVDEDWSHMIDFRLIVFLGNQNLGFNTNIFFLCNMVLKLLNIQYFLDHAHLWCLG